MSARPSSKHHDGPERGHGLAEILVGQGVDDVDRLWQRMYYNTNRYGRRGAQSMPSGCRHRVVGPAGPGPRRAPLRTARRGPQSTGRAYASLLFGETPEETARLATEAVGQGLTAANSAGKFSERTSDRRGAHRAAREALGDDRDLMIDVGCKWDAGTAWNVRGSRNPTD
ncbi:MAG: hypothetical protein Ct9H300mP1_06690 [Planctomycetaceae bacterium]|nr:MAG: hypothetical protein Ct9H300mP1_06690 [Planctomycetaceae bacterium]